MADSTIPLTGTSTGKILDTETLTGAGSATVERQRLQVAGVALAEITRVMNSGPIGSEYGLVTRPIGPLQVKTTDNNGNSITAFPAGFMRTSDEPRQLFYDPFDGALDTTNRWATPTTFSGGTAASTTGGVLTLASGTTANGFSVLQSQPTFVPTVPSWLGTSFAIKIPNPTVLNQYMFWGVGTNPTTPSTTAPLTDAYGFELYTDQKLYCVTYAAGVRTVIQDLSAATGNSKQPADANYHRYIIYYRTDKIFFYIDGLDSTQLVGSTTNFQGPSIQTLPIKLMSGGGATPPLSSGILSCTGLATWDTGKNNTMLSDGTYPWRKATISSGGALSVLTSDTTTGSTVLGSNGANIQLAMAGVQSCGFQLAAGTLIGTIIAEASFDGGTNWVPTLFDDPATGNKSASVVFGSANTLTSRSIVGVGGASHLRVRVSAYTSGTANAIMRGGMIHDPSVLYAGQPNATTQPPTVAMMGAWDGTTIRAGKSDVNGNFQVRLTDNTNFMPTMDAVARKGFLAITDGTNGPAAVKAASTAAVAADPSLVVALHPTSPLPVAAAVATSPIGAVTLGSTANKANVLKTGTLVTTVVTADQVILTYTVTSGKTFYLQYIEIMARLTVLTATATILGTASVETPSGTKDITVSLVQPTTGEVQRHVYYFSEPIPVAATVVIRVVCTPAAVTSTTWLASFGGYEK